MLKQLVVATNNLHKLDEIRNLLGLQWQVMGAGDVAPGISWDETGSTFLENARIKISALRPFTKGAILADDSGLCVDSLGGRPGVFSSSFGGVEGDHKKNVKQLLEAMDSVPSSSRGAHFYCLLLYSPALGEEFSFEGRCHGKISTACQGAGGFGYDPVFLVGTSGQSLAEMSAEEKNAVSHRGVAMRAFVKSFLPAGF
jgi:XTP/dITP diphosphohydrolase